MQRLRSIHDLFQDPGAMDSRQLELTRKISILAQSMGLGFVKVKMGFNGHDPIATTISGEKYFYSGGKLMPVEPAPTNLDYGDYE